MNVEVWAGTLTILLFVFLILWQIILLFAQKKGYEKMRKDYNEFKSNIEGSLKTDMDKVIRENRELISSINKLIESRINK